MPKHRNDRALLTAVAYIRSSKEEARLGPAVQREAIERWCDEHDVSLLSVHHDRGVSGGSRLEARHHLHAAIDEIECRRASFLVVMRRDRLSRDATTAGLIERMVARVGGAIRSSDGTGNGSGPEAVLQRGVSDVYAEYERAVLRMRTKAALVLKKARGERTGSVPWGHRLSGDGVHLVIDPGEQIIVRLVRRLHRRGWSLRQITAELERRGFRNRANSAKWWPASVQGMLRC